MIDLQMEAVLDQHELETFDAATLVTMLIEYSQALKMLAACAYEDAADLLQLLKTTVQKLETELQHRSMSNSR